MYARFTSLGNSFRSRTRSKSNNSSSSNNNNVVSTEEELIQRTKAIIDNDIQQRGKLHLTYNTIKEKLINEFGITLYDKCKPFVQDLIKQAAPRTPRSRSAGNNEPLAIDNNNNNNNIPTTRRRATTANEDIRQVTTNNNLSTMNPNIFMKQARPTNITTATIYKASTTDQSTMKHDLYGAMSRTLTEQQVDALAEQLHSSWPKKISEMKNKTAKEQMELERGGIMSHKEGKDGMNLKVALESARNDPKIQAEMKARQQQLRNNNKPFSPRQHNYTPRRRASTLATPGQNIESTLAYNQTFVYNVQSPKKSNNNNNNNISSSTAESRRRSLNSLQQQQQQKDATGNFMIPNSPNTKRTKFRSPSFEDSDINPRMKYTTPMFGGYATQSISERAQRLSQISFLKRKGILSDSQRALAKDLLLQGDQGIMIALKMSETNPLKLVSYLSTRMGQVGIESLSHLKSMKKKVNAQNARRMSVDGGIANNNNNKQRGRPKRRRSSKEGTVGTREAPRIWSEEEDKLLLNAVEKYGPKNWKSIATEVPNRNHVQCLQRYKKVLKPGLKRGGWTPQEDELLRQLYKNEMRRQNVVIHDETRPTHVSIAFLIHIHIYIYLTTTYVYIYITTPVIDWKRVIYI